MPRGFSKIGGFRQWHVNCIVCAQEFMAAKMNVMKLLQEIRGLAVLSSRRVQSRLPALSIVPWRARSSSARKRFIRIDMQGGSADIPDPVKITHIAESRPSRPQPAQTP